MAQGLRGTRNQLNQRYLKKLPMISQQPGWLARPAYMPDEG